MSHPEFDFDQTASLSPTVEKKIAVKRVETAKHGVTKVSRLSVPTLALALALSAIVVTLASFATAQPYGGGWGMMGGYGPGSGMMYGPGYGPGCYGPAMMYGCNPGYGPGYGPGYTASGDLNLSTDDVKNYLSRWIAVQGNSHIKVGDVKEQDADTIVADIVTQDNSLVQRFVVNRHTGFYRPSEK